MLASLGLAALGFLARALPPGLGYALAGAGGRLHHRLAHRRRAALRSNLRQVLAFSSGRDAAGDHLLDPNRELDRLVARAFSSHGAFLYEWLRSTAGSRLTLTLSGRAYLDRALDSGRGAILAACHLGNWEVAACELARAGYPLAVVTGEQLGRLAPAVRGDKRRRGIGVWRPADGARALYRLLEANRILVLLVDGDVWRRGRRVPFLGRATLFPGGAVRLARSTGACLLAGTMRRTGPLAFEARIHQPVPLAPDDSPEAVLRALVGPLEHAIASDPAQWCLFRSLWDEPPHRAARPAKDARTAA